MKAPHGTVLLIALAALGVPALVAPAAALTVTVRRDTGSTITADDWQSQGVSGIVSGTTTASTVVTVTLTHAGGTTTRTTQSAPNGAFGVWMGRSIADGDTVDVSDGSTSRTVQVPTLTYSGDGATKVITGIGPANVTSTTNLGPHTLQLRLGVLTYPLTTDGSGAFSVTLTNNYIVGLLGYLRYTTAAGDNVFKPLFIVDQSPYGQPGDWRPDVILGQPDFSSITPNETTASKLFNPGGIFVDRSVRPNRVYVYDNGNNRVLGFHHLGVVASGPNAGEPCTSNSDWFAPCQIDATRAADVVLGQPSFTTSPCNGDSAYRSYPDAPYATASSLCTMGVEQTDVTGGGSRATMAADAQGNLYVPDFFNNRILRYDSPFTTDGVADYVWGQANFAGGACNRGRTSPTGPPVTDAASLCLAAKPSDTGNKVAGVAVDPAGNLWVADAQNNRVLRFPNVGGVPAATADLVLGQPSFTTASANSGLAQMGRPVSVRIHPGGAVYVADGNRVLVFAPPLSNGMAATRTLGSGLTPVGIEIDTAGGIWVNDFNADRWRRYTPAEQLDVSVAAAEHNSSGGLGIDADNNVLGTGWDLQEGLRYSPPTYAAATRTNFLQSGPEEGTFNQTTARGFSGFPGSIEVTADQLMMSDNSRLLFWNQPARTLEPQARGRRHRRRGFSDPGEVGAVLRTDDRRRERAAVGAARQRRPDPVVHRALRPAAHERREPRADDLVAAAGARRRDGHLQRRDVGRRDSGAAVVRLSLGRRRGLPSRASPARRQHGARGRRHPRTDEHDRRRVRLQPGRQRVGFVALPTGRLGIRPGREPLRRGQQLRRCHLRRRQQASARVRREHLARGAGDGCVRAAGEPRLGHERQLHDRRVLVGELASVVCSLRARLRFAGAHGHRDEQRPGGAALSDGLSGPDREPVSDRGDRRLVVAAVVDALRPGRQLVHHGRQPESHHDLQVGDGAGGADGDGHGDADHDGDAHHDADAHADRDDHCDGDPDPDGDGH